MRCVKSDTRLLLGFAVLAIGVTAGGCGAMAQLLYVVKGHDIPAAYPGFENKRVAIVVNTKSSSFGPDPLAETIAQQLHFKLGNGVSDIVLVPDTEVKNWIDLNQSEGTNLVDLGRGVGADLVLGVDIDNYKIRQGRTMYKGRADVEVSVVDTQSGGKSFALGPQNMAFPENGRPALSTTDREFQAFYLSWLTERIARNFYKHDKAADFADDAAYGG